MAAAHSGTLSADLPLTKDGMLDAERVRELLSQRDQRPVQLLE